MLNQAIDRSKVLKASFFAILAALVTNLIVRAILGLFYPIDPAFMPLGYGSIALFTIFYCVIASVIFYLVVRFTRRPVRNFIIISIVAFLFSLVQNFMGMANPASMPMGGTSTDYAVLIIFHITALITYVYTVLRFSKA